MARDLEKRAPQFPDLSDILPPAESTTTRRGGGGGGGGGGEEESTSTHSTEHSTSTVSTPTNDPETSTSTSTSDSSSSTSSQPSSSSSSSSRQAAASTQRTTIVASNTRFASQGSSYMASRSSATVTETASGDANSGARSSFLSNKTAIAATVTVALLVVLGALIFIAVWLKKKNQRGNRAEEDMWDEASMKEFSRPGGAGVPITPPPPAPIAFADDGYQQSGLTRSKTVLPSQSAGAAPLTRARSQQTPPRREVETDDEPDQILAMPPVTHFERPRDSAYDIVPAAPPAAAFASGAYASHGGGYTQEYTNAYASGSGSSGLVPPKRAGDHSSFGSALSSDPFAGTGFVDATRESTYGPGQAGRGAGYKMNSSSPGNTGGPHMGSQWPQGYDPYSGYSQGGQSPYGGGYGYAR
ncbi:hypothetical protein FRC17_009064 [Serendipita sp. 399]|nr:hypothetical protein FRC17_009064 [Serendipita sp. 399]